uniref:alpha-L-fucosidase n=1 Tax=Caulobacter sp. (strain K31) TaxID=366602 RepID=B0T1B4_CAUSK
MAKFSKREILYGPLLALGAGALGRAGPTAAAAAPTIERDMARGPFNTTQESLETYRTPDWFRDAKFGIWAHWGPQAVPRQGDWYARWLYVPGHPHYDHHLKTYGHPSEKGYKDILPLWKAERWDPEALMARYAGAGAKYFVSMGVHHDNFDLWNSKHHRWNAVAMGPKRDIVGAWKAAAKRQGLRFGVSEHLGASYCWWYPSHLYDQFWPKLGVPYDGADPAYADLYHDNRDEPYLNTKPSWYTRNPTFHQLWLKRIRDLVDSYQPDLLYSDGGLPFGEVGRTLVAHLYNSSITRTGRLEAVYTCKDVGTGEFFKEGMVQDVERGVLKGVNPLPWQTDTSNGDWFDSDNVKYKTSSEIITMLADIVSKNGNMLLNIVLHADGSLPPESDALLTDLSAWMAVNAEAIHGTRPWTHYGEGPTEVAEGMFKEKADYSARDIRFTVKDKTLYAIALGEPSDVTEVVSLRKGAPEARGRVVGVELLGAGPVHFRQTSKALLISVPARLPTRHASVFKIHLA